MATADTTCNYLCCIWPWILPDMICLLIFDGYSLAMDGKFENQGTKDVGFINDLTLSGWATNLGVAYFWTKPWEQKYVWGGNNQVDYPETIDMNSCMFYWPERENMQFWLHSGEMLSVRSRSMIACWYVSCIDHEHGWTNRRHTGEFVAIQVG